MSSGQYLLLYDPSFREITYGSVGIQGFQAQGIQGRQGFQAGGAQGAFGLFGFQGRQNTGFQGFQGIGLQGNQGLFGFQGSGNQGFIGAQGIQGFQGALGVFPYQVQPIAIGTQAGFTGQAITGVALGFQAGYQGQGQFTIALGVQAGFQNQASNSIILNATGTQVNAGTTGFFIDPLRFTNQIPFQFDTQGIFGIQGFQQGPQGFQGFQGLQGRQGIQGVQGIPGGSNTNIQYNTGAISGGSTNLTFNPTTTVFSFGTGQTGGQFNIIGGLIQGPTGSSLNSLGNAILAYNNVGRYVELGAESTNFSYIDFHSNDNVANDYDTRILSVNGTTSVDGGGRFNFYGDGGYIFTGANAPVQLTGQFIWASGGDRTSATNEIVGAGSIANGLSNILVYSSLDGGIFNIMANNGNGNYATTYVYGAKTGATAYTWNTIQTFTNSTGINITLTNTASSIPGLYIYLTNTTPGGNIAYWMIDANINPNFG